MKYDWISLVESFPQKSLQLWMNWWFSAETKLSCSQQMPADHTNNRCPYGPAKRYRNELGKQALWSTPSFIWVRLWGFFFLWTKPTLRNRHIFFVLTKFFRSNHLIRPNFFKYRNVLLVFFTFPLQPTGVNK